MIIRSLTALRIIAALMVFVSHLYLYQFLFQIQDGPAYDFLHQLGAAGVALFFVLSGFVLFINYAPRDGQPFNVGRFYSARIARIYPVFLLTTLLALPIEIMSPDTQSLWLPFLLNLLLLHCLIPETCHSLNVVGWSISTEAVFYLLFPLLAGLFVSRAFRNLAFALLLFGGYLGLMVSLFGQQFYADAGFPLNRLGEFLTGMALGHAYRQYADATLLKQLAQQKTQACILIMLLFLGMGVQPFVISAFPLLQPVWYLYYLLPSAGIIFLLAILEKHHRPPALFTAPWMILGGEISYAFYLLHHLVLRYAIHFFKLVLHVDIAQLSPIISIPTAFVLLIITWMLSVITYYRVEKPCKQIIFQFFQNRCWRSQSKWNELKLPQSQ